MMQKLLPGTELVWNIGSGNSEVITAIENGTLTMKNTNGNITTVPVQSVLDDIAIGIIVVQTMEQCGYSEENPCLDSANSRVEENAETGKCFPAVVGSQLGVFCFRHATAHSYTLNQEAGI